MAKLLYHDQSFKLENLKLLKIVLVMQADLQLWLCHLVTQVFFSITQLSFTSSVRKKQDGAV